MLAVSVASPLAGGSQVVLSGWRDIHEGARAHLLSIPGICRFDVRPLADSLAIRFVSDPDAEIHRLQGGLVRGVQLESGVESASLSRRFGQGQSAFRGVRADRTVDVSVIIAVAQLSELGLVRVSAQAIVTEAGGA